jgi:hypothetical protein
MTASRLSLITPPLKHVNQGFKGGLISNSRDVVISFDQVQEFRFLSLARNSANMIRQGRYLIAFCGLVLVLKCRTGDDYVSAITDYTTLKALLSRL